MQIIILVIWFGKKKEERIYNKLNKRIWKYNPKLVKLNNYSSSDSKSSGINKSEYWLWKKVLTDNASVSVSSSKSNMSSNKTGLNEKQFVNEREIGERYERK